MYYAYKHKTALDLLCIITCPFACCISCPLYCYFNPPMISPCGNANRNARKRKRQVMTTVHLEHKGRRINRRKSLSEGTEVGFWKSLSRKPTLHQSNSPLFSTLPAEVRTLIFEFFLAGTGAVFVYHGLGPDPKFDAVKAVTYDLEKATISSEARQRAKVQMYLVDNYLGNDMWGYSDSKTALLRTCRRIYTEARPILYSQTQFVFNNLSIKDQFWNAFPRTHLQHIRSVRFEIGERYRWVMPDVENDLVRFVESRPQLRTVDVALDVGEVDQFGSRGPEDVERCARKMSEVASIACRVHAYGVREFELVYETVKQGTRH
jgi:hypothetical protein